MFCMNLCTVHELHSTDKNPNVSIYQNPTCYNYSFCVWLVFLTISPGQRPIQTARYDFQLPRGF